MHLNNDAAESALNPDRRARRPRSQGTRWTRRPSAQTRRLPRSPGSGNLLYCRNITNAGASARKDREQGKKYEYFVLTRDDRERRAQEVTGDYLTSAPRGQSEQRTAWPSHFSFNTEGGSRFYDLTTATSPPAESGFKRQLAIVLDGQMRSAPTLQRAISQQRPDHRRLHAGGDRQTWCASSAPAPCRPRSSRNRQREHDGRHARRGHHQIRRHCRRRRLRRPCWSSCSSTTASPASWPASPCWPTCC